MAKRPDTPRRRLEQLIAASAAIRLVREATASRPEHLAPSDGRLVTDGARTEQGAATKARQATAS